MQTNKPKRGHLAVILLLVLTACSQQQAQQDVVAATDSRTSEVSTGWAQTSVNAVIFRHDSITTHEDTQIVAFYDAHARVMLARRQIGSDIWTVQATQYEGDATDAHNSISIMMDGDGYLHLAWNHHVDELHYAVSLEPLGLDLGARQVMIGNQESKVTYPEFHRLPNGGLIFIYRDGTAGNGKAVLNRFDIHSRKWTRLHDSLIDGEGQRNPYWQLHVGHNGTLHISWVWRESSDAATNYDMHYARSTDGGTTWENSDAQSYVIPITEARAEVALNILQGSNLINQTSMTSDTHGNPYIATWFRRNPDDVTQIHLIHRSDSQMGWQQEPITTRLTDFELGGGGSKELPISRPQILSRTVEGTLQLLVLFRDAESDHRAMLASSSRPAADAYNNVSSLASWRIKAVSDSNLDRWEPTFDSVLWRDQQKLHVFQQSVSQIDGEGLDIVREATPVSVLEIALPER